MSLKLSNLTVIRRKGQRKIVYSYALVCVYRHSFHVSDIGLLEQGKLALAFGDLLRKLWAPGATTVYPEMFKSTIASFAPQFSGYNQHDSQVSEVLFIL